MYTYTVTFISCKPGEYGENRMFTMNCPYDVEDKQFQRLVYTRAHNCVKMCGYSEEDYAGVRVVKPNNGILRGDDYVKFIS